MVCLLVLLPPWVVRSAEKNGFDLLSLLDFFGWFDTNFDNHLSCVVECSPSVLVSLMRLSLFSLRMGLFSTLFFVLHLFHVKFRRKDLSLYRVVFSYFLVQNKNMIGYRTMSGDITRCHITRSDLNRWLTFHTYRS